MISKCTIIIPTFNRPRYLKRILSYYDKYGRDFNIIVADSSSNENKKLNKKAVSIFPNLNIQHLNNYSPKINLFHKIADALNHVNTRYTVFCADDDFIIPNGINKSVEFLEKNSDFSCAHGHYISFSFKTDKMGRKKIYWVPICPYKSISFVNTKERLFFHFSSYYPTFYAVHRTDLLKLTFKENIEFTDGDVFSELLPSMLDLIYGKMKKMDIFYSAEESIIDSAGRTSKTFHDFINNGTYEKKYNKFRECLAKTLVTEEDISKEKAQKLIDKAMNQYLGSSMLKLKLKASLRRIAEHNALLKKFYLAYRQFRTSRKQIPALDSFLPIEYGSKENPYHGDEDFIRIKEAVEKGIIK